MIAIDTNVLVYARRREMPHHAAALALVERLANGDDPWAIPWPCIYEFLRVVTHPRVFAPPTDMDTALSDLASLLDSPSLHVLSEGPRHRHHMRRMTQAAGISGNLVHDAHIAALAVEHGVSELLTADGDFARFPGLACRNPFQPA